MATRSCCLRGSPKQRGNFFLSSPFWGPLRRHGLKGATSSSVLCSFLPYKKYVQVPNARPPSQRFFVGLQRFL